MCSSGSLNSGLLSVNFVSNQWMVRCYLEGIFNIYIFYCSI